MTKQQAITVCGSMSFEPEMTALGASLERQGFTVYLPETGDTDTELQGGNIEELKLKKRQYINNHLQNIKASNLVLIANFEKKSTPGYIGANTLMEAAFGYSLAVPVILLNYPGKQNCQLEILSVASNVLSGDISELTSRIARSSQKSPSQGYKRPTSQPPSSFFT